MTTNRATYRRSVGRYSDEARRARVPGDQLARPLPSLNIRTAIGAVPDPYEPGELIAVVINRRTDILEEERARGAISEGAYRTGREIQAAYEVRSPSSSNWNDGGRGDPTTAQELRHLAMQRRARRAIELSEDIVHAVGVKGAEHIRRVLGENWSYADIAAREGRPGDRGRRQVAFRFRELLEDVTEHRSAKGRA
jgi:hypothetical protein